MVAVIGPDERVLLLCERCPQLGAHVGGGLVEPECRSCLTVHKRVEYYFCIGCERYVPFCDGAFDDTPELCTRCANAVHDARAGFR